MAIGAGTFVSQYFFANTFCKSIGICRSFCESIGTKYRIPERHPLFFANFYTLFKNSVKLTENLVKFSVENVSKKLPVTLTEKFC